MEIPVGHIHWKNITIAEIERIQQILAEEEEGSFIDLNRSIGNIVLRDWLIGFCNYLICQANMEYS